MTLEHEIGGTALLSSTSTAAQPSSSLKHSLRSATKAAAAAKAADEQAENAHFVKEEEKLMVEDDEEVTSEEEEPDNVATERTMLTVALVKSVVETHNNNNSTSSSSSQHGGGPPSPGSHTYGLRKRRRPSGADLKRLEHFQSTKEGGLARLPKIEEAPSLPGPDKGLSKSLSPRSKRSTPVSSGSRTAPKAEPDPAPEPQASLKIVSSVPNPLLKSTDAPVTASRGDALTPFHPGSLLETLVHCPLPDPTSASTSAPPRSKVPTAFATEALEAPEKRKVTINEPDLISRKRGFSVDLDFFELGDDTSTAPSGNVGRGRTFSFECFAFGINADEPLPPLDQHTHPASSSSLDFHGRPRGDSIIFDPVSFMDGGIHEQNALEKHSTTVVVRAAGSNSPIPTLPMKKPAITTSSAFRPATTDVQSASTQENAPPSSSTMNATSKTVSCIASNTSVTTTTTTTTITTNPATGTAFSLELLNKDGRIGIYLPEARRSRIARFHAKRSRRIWRKRIKYDCRKKLADSRPRIKGRFVKRSDMDD